MKHIMTSSMRADRITPQVAFLKLNALALLESAVLDIGKSRYSFLVVSEHCRLSLEDAGVTVTYPGKAGRVDSADKREYLRILKRMSTEARDIAGRDDFPHPLPVGGIGFLGYETVAYMEDVVLAEQEDDLNLPEAVFIFGESFVIFDHYKDELIVCIVHEEENLQQAKGQVKQITDRLFDFDFRAYQGDEDIYSCSIDLDRDKDLYIKGVEQVRRAIIKGDLLQGVLSRRIDIHSSIPPFEAYRRLRRENPSPYMFYINFGEFILFGASPEVMVSCNDRIATLKPIAGTRPRGKTRKEDIALEEELLQDEKERSEHLMLIDLARNDLNRVCSAGSVRVLHSFSVQRFSHVMHIVSEVEGELKAECDIFDLMTSAFPAGTVTGAPKIKALELISEMERVRRGPYAGLVGYLDLHGGLDSCITIRSAVYKDGVFYIQSGAGIVYDSQPEKEYLETISKAQAMCVSLGVDLP